VVNDLSGFLIKVQYKIVVGASLALTCLVINSFKESISVHHYDAIDYDGLMQ